MRTAKRRPASTQAVSRKVEGIEPRNQGNRKDDDVRMYGSQHRHHRHGEEMPASSGSETMACVTSTLHGNPGDPAAAFGGGREYAGQPPKGRKAKERQGVGSFHSTAEGG